MDPRPALWQRLGTTRDLDDPLSAEVRLLVEFEKRAHRIHTFEPLLIPGLLQTREYAEVALGLYVPPSALDQQVAARLARQALFDNADAPLTRFLIDEAALRHWPGAEVRARILEAAGRPRVDVRIVPFRAGLHEGVKGPLVVLELDDGDILYLEDEKGDVIHTEPAAVRRYAERFERLSAFGVPAADFLGT